MKNNLEIRRDYLSALNKRYGGITSEPYEDISAYSLNNFITAQIANERADAAKSMLKLAGVSTTLMVIFPLVMLIASVIEIVNDIYYYDVNIYEVAFAVSWVFLLIQSLATRRKIKNLCL
jgi:hypothetical protein